MPLTHFVGETKDCVKEGHLNFLVPCVAELEHLLLAGLPGSGHFFLHFVHGVGLELQELGALLGLLFPGLLLHKLFQLHGPGGVIFIVARHCGGFFAVVWKGGGGSGVVQRSMKADPTPHVQHIPAAMATLPIHVTIAKLRKQLTHK